MAELLPAEIDFDWEAMGWWSWKHASIVIRDRNRQSHQAMVLHLEGTITGVPRSESNVVFSKTLHRENTDKEFRAEK